MIIDFCVTPPFKEFMIVPEYAKDYQRLYGPKKWDQCSDEGFIEFLDESGIDIAVIRARDVETTLGKGMKIPNEACAELVSKYPKRLIGLAGVDPFKGRAAVDELEYAIVEIETSIHFRRAVRMDLCRPLYLDYVAVAFPDLKLVGCTPGWPWVSELMGVVWRHPNVYFSTESVRPKYLGMPGTGYETLMQFGNSILQDKAIFGSMWPSLPIKQCVEETSNLPLKPEVKEKWLYKNAARLFGIEGE